MRRHISTVCLVGLALAIPRAQQPELRTATTSVLFDVVVRDGRGRPVNGLSLSDFELQEDGTRQQLTALFVRRTSTVAGVMPPVEKAGVQDPLPASTPVIAPSEPDATSTQIEDGPAAMAFVFDQLTPESRVLAGRVAEGMLATLPTDDWLGVFALEQALHVAHGFSRDREAARAALARVAQRPLVLRDASGTLSPRTGVDLDPSTSPTVGAESAGGAPDFQSRQRMLVDGGPADLLMYQMEMRMADTYERYTRDVQGQTAAVGLRAIAAAMAPLRGRKAIVLFSEGLPLSDQARPVFDTMVATANRAGVTFYPVDAVGLRAHSTVAATAREQDHAGRVALGDEGRSQGAWTRDLEKQADLVRSDGTASLARLARETGGLLVEHTNDATSIGQRIAEDQRSHYLLAYTPTRAEMDGTYRRVNVSVKRRGMNVVHRTGYWAVAVTP